MKINLNSEDNNRSSSYLVSDYLTKILLAMPRLTGRIESIFEKGFNLLIQEQLIFVGTDENNLSAFGIVIPRQTFGKIKSEIFVGQQVRLASTVENNHFIHLKWTIYSRPRTILVEMTDIKIVATGLPKLAIKQVLKPEVMNAFNQDVIWKQSGFTRSEYLENYYMQLQNSWNNDLAKHLIGAGIGLTPSGDDFLQGYIMMALVTGVDEQHVIPAIQSALEKRTTTRVSFNYYQVLFKGHVNYMWLNVFQAIENQDITGLQNAIQQVQQYGATSGNDILLGVRTYLNLYKSKYIKGGNYG